MEACMDPSKKSKLILLAIIFSSFVPCVASQSIPKPEDILGFKVGADYHLATYNQAIEYFKKLAENSDRVKLFDAGHKGSL